jgi:hypothetical protein
VIQAFGSPLNRIDRLRGQLGASMRDAGSALAAADQLCHACVDLLDVDGAAVSLMYAGTTRGTFGSSGGLSRRLDELQFTSGEGPCLDAVSLGFPVLVGDLLNAAESRWPLFRSGAAAVGIAAVFALPITVATETVGALDLFRQKGRALTGEALLGGLWAAELAALPLLDLMNADVDWYGLGQGDGWDQLASLERVEVYQATGMLIGALGISGTDALVRLRGHAAAHDMTASEVAWAIVKKRLSLDPDDWQPGYGTKGVRR